MAIGLVKRVDLRGGNGDDDDDDGLDRSRETERESFDECGCLCGWHQGNGRIRIKKHSICRVSKSWLHANVLNVSSPLIIGTVG